MTAQNSHIITIDDAQAAVAPTKPSRFQILFERENLTVEIYRPVSTDHQKPHNHDECYVIIEGAGGGVKWTAKLSILSPVTSFLWPPACRTALLILGKVCYVG